MIDSLFVDKNSKLNDNESQHFDPDSLECSEKIKTFSMPREDAATSCFSIDPSFQCELNYMDTSQFITSNGFEQNNVDISDSEFMSKDKALEIFEKDEEILKDEHKFEAGNDSKGSTISVFLPLGKLIFLLPLAFFGIDVSTPVRHISEESFVFGYDESTFEASNDKGDEKSFVTLSLASESKFEKDHGNEESALSSMLGQDYQNKSESEILHRSDLSRFLSDISTSQPQALADRILHAAFNKVNSVKSSNKIRHKEQNATDFYSEYSSINYKDSNKTSSTLTASALSKNKQLQETAMSNTKEHDVLVSSSMDISSADSSSTKMEEKILNHMHVLTAQLKRCSV
ncbi:centrosomal protein [Caerostris extrusa]|uniref:Centrosomal protein n=1 Tax=Caerostris extrusa TaxID=172846 RepID=A0AAV4WWQ5_CAEEX|nr:centrosomal protein [Caerostris extrusa]